MAKNRRRQEYLPIANNPKYRPYHDAYDDYRMRSIILNAESRNHSMRTGSHTDLTYLQNMLYELIGNKDGKYFVPNTSSWKYAIIPTLKVEINEFQKDFAAQNKRNTMMEGRRSEEMSGKTLEKYLILLARYDVYREERDYLNETIEKIKNQQQEIARKKILQNGPRGSGKLNDGYLIIIDGQKVSSIKTDKEETLLIIDEPSSPYDGLAVADYREFIVKPFLKSNGALHAKMHKEASDRGNYASSYKMNKKAPFPTWPEGAINYKKPKPDKKKKRN